MCLRKRKHYITIWMDCKTLPQDAIIAAGGGSGEIGWFAWDALPSPLFVPLENLLKENCYPPNN
jgi:hypothetical protein